MSLLRYTTDCATGRRIWHLYASVGRPERSLWWPCARALSLAAPLALGPSAFVPGGAAFPIAPVPPAPPAWHEGQGFVPWAGSPYALPWMPNGESSLLAPNVMAAPLPTLTPERIAVPEPPAWTLAAVGAGAAALVRRRRG